MKRLIDFLISLLAIIILSVPMVIIAIIIRVTIGAPIIFTQQRPGIKGKPFYINKFRTMTNETDDLGNLLPNELRITKTGKVITQLFNVLNGEIDFIGPRPLLMEYLALYNREQSRRHDVRPGITGWAQVNGRNNISWEERFRLDVWYVDNRSVLLDVKIILLTILKVFKREDVTPNDRAFIKKFKGGNEDDAS